MPLTCTALRRVPHHGLARQVHPSVHPCEGGFAVELTDGADVTYAVVKLQEA